MPSQDLREHRHTSTDGLAPIQGFIARPFQDLAEFSQSANGCLRASRPHEVTDPFRRLGNPAT